MNHRIDRLTAPLLRGLRRAGLGLALVLVLAASAYAQTPAEKLGEARAAFDALELDKALGLFTEISKDQTADRSTRVEALGYLGRIYVAKDRFDDARAAMGVLVELQPPLVEFDPERETPDLMRLYYEARKDYLARHGAENPYAVPTTGPGIRTIAVVDFENYAIFDHDRYDPLQRGLAAMMSRQLNGAVDLKVVERLNLEWILNEHNLQRGPVVDQTTAVQAGKLMGAHAMVFGGIHSPDDDRILLEARVVKIETGEVLQGASIEGKKKEFYKTLEKLSLEVARLLNSEVTPEEVGLGTDTKVLDAKISFSEGEREFDKGNYLEARVKFLEALQYDPDYKLAQLRLQALEPMLAARTTEGSDTSGSGMSGTANPDENEATPASGNFALYYPLWRII